MNLGSYFIQILSNITLKKNEYLYKRVRQSLKYKRNEILYNKANEELAEFKILAGKEKIKLIYLDESGFAGDLPVNYSWTKKGQQKHIPKINNSNTKINVLGLFDYKKQQMAYSTTQDKMDSEMFISLFDITKPESKVPVYIVLDNYSIHTSKKTKKKRIEWEKENIFFYHIPPSCPELNLIEGKWRNLKHNRIRKRYFDNSNDLESTVKREIDIMNNKA
jgi:transposase